MNSENSTDRQPTDRQLREAFGHFATGVSIITAEHEGIVYGMTVNSFTSLSLSPPLVLWCLASDEAHQVSYDLFKDVETFSVSVLNEEQEALSRYSARHGHHQLDDDQLDGDQLDGEAVNQQGGLFIKDALVGFRCSVQQRLQAGDHIIIIGTIEHCEVFDKEKKPLIFYQKKYHSLK